MSRGGWGRTLGIGLLLSLLLAGLALLVTSRLKAHPKSRATPTLPIGLVVDVTAVEGEVSPYVFGANYGPWMVVPYELMDEAQAAGLRFLRFPGGNWGDQHDLRPYQIDAYIQLARQLGAEPSISVRLRGGTPEQAAALVRYTNIEKGYGVRFWSIGNEPSLYPDYDTERFNREWRAFAEAMRAVDPTIRLIGPEIHQFTADPAANPKDRHGHDWMTAFLEANGDLVDIISFHRYPFPRCRTCPPASVEELRANAAEWDDIIRYLRATVREITGEDKPIAVTEVNSHWNKAVGKETTPDGFYNAIWWADVLGRLIRNRVFIVAYFALQTSPGAGPWGLLASRDVRPTYYVYRLYREFGTHLVAARWHAPVAEVSAYAAVRDDAALTVVLVNRGQRPQEVPLTVTGAAVRGPVTVTRLDREHFVERVATLTYHPGLTLSLPEASVTLLTIPIEHTTPTSTSRRSKPMKEPMKPSERNGVSVVSPFAAEIPAVAWSRPIGLPVPNPPRPRTEYPIVDDGPYQGAPLGGIGAGTIGRTYRGDFARWHLDIGRHHYEPIPASMFSVFMAQGNHRVVQALWTEKPDRVLSAWRWKYPVGAGTYYALYPRSWFVYTWEEFPAQLMVEQFSPVLPHNYRESSYPVAIFLWRAYNPTAEPVQVGLLFTWQNVLGRWWDGLDRQGGHVHAAREELLASGTMVGVVMTDGQPEVVEGWQGSFAIAALETEGVRVTYRTRFRADGDGAEIWADFAADGALENVDDRTPAAEGEPLAAGLAVTFELAPAAEKEVPIVLAWDLPIAQFGGGDKWHRRYTRFFGTSGRNAWAIARDALEHYREWRQAIVDWQERILAEESRPEWFKQALFNELYYVADGGTAWVVDPEDPEGIGHFAQLETYDYPFYETLDVRFYGSFPLLMLWPELEKQVMRDFIPTVLAEDLTRRRVESNGQFRPRKLAGAVPHDLGMPAESPFRLPNAYAWQDPNVWKDLNSKFVLLIYRDVVYTGDEALLREAWPAVKAALEYLKRFDRDGDGLPENDGIPDQTFDTWPMKGPSAYCGGLWLAALAAARRMAELVGDTEAAETYARWYTQGQAAYEAKLWNGRYYRYDTDSAYRDAIMADQLAGQWYADVTGLPAVVPEDHVRSVLETVYRHNVLGFADGQMGAVNGVRPDGSLYTDSDQAEEVWVGVTYALAAFMLHRGMDEAAWQTAFGAYRVTYERGLWFRTPEAWDKDGNFRASMYLRPGAIWAMEYALRRRVR